MRSQKGRFGQANSENNSLHKGQTYLYFNRSWNIFENHMNCQSSAVVLEDGPTGLRSIFSSENLF